jgi:DNA-binding transcriptional MerR regulator
MINHVNSHSSVMTDQETVAGDLAATGLFSLIGQLAERAGISPMAIRYYEREGLLSPSRFGRLRAFGAEDERRLKTIVMLRGLGLPIARIRKALELTMTDKENGAAYAQLLHEHLDALNAERKGLALRIVETEAILARLGADHGADEQQTENAGVTSLATAKDEP